MAEIAIPTLSTEHDLPESNSQKRKREESGNEETSSEAFKRSMTNQELDEGYDSSESVKHRHLDLGINSNEQYHSNSTNSDNGKYDQYHHDPSQHYQRRNEYQHTDYPYSGIQDHQSSDSIDTQHQQSRQTNSSGSAFTSRDYELKPGEISEIVDVDQDVVGRVIGRGGETIRDLQARCGCHIQVNQDFPPGVPRKVVISGIPHKVDLAKEMIESVKVHGPQGLGTSGVEISAKFQIIECPQHLVGKVIGKHGETINGIKAQSGARVQVDQNYPDGVPRKITVNGNPQQVQFAVQLLQQLISSGGNVMNGQTSGTGTQTIDIPRTFVGRVIGRNGETLRQLKQKTGANIYVDQNVVEGSPCKAIISGPPDAVANAVYWVQDVMVNGPANLSLLSAQLTNSAYLSGAAALASGYSSMMGGVANGYSAMPYSTPFYTGYGNTNGLPTQQTNQMSMNFPYQQQQQQQQQQQVQQQQQQQQSQSKKSAWIEYKTSDGTPYYYNTVTQTTQWQKPDGI